MTKVRKNSTAGSKRKKRERAWELDFLRGVAVLCMCFDHLMYDLGYAQGWFSVKGESGALAYLRDFARAYWATSATDVYGFRFWAHYIFVFLFLFLVGVSCSFSRNNTKRGAMLGVVALIFTGATMVLKKVGIMEYGIVFGILDCIALSILCVAAVDNITRPSKKANLYVPLILGVIIVGAGIDMRFWDFGKPYDNVFTHENFLGYIFGTNGFGDDWFGLFPYVGMVFLGVYWGKAVYPKRKSLLPMLDGKWNKPIAFVGRHALLFYIAHQIVIAGIVGAAYLIAGYRF